MASCPKVWPDLASNVTVFTSTFALVDPAAETYWTYIQTPFASGVPNWNFWEGTSQALLVAAPYGIQPGRMYVRVVPLANPCCQGAAAASSAYGGIVSEWAFGALKVNATALENPPFNAPKGATFAARSVTVPQGFYKL